MSLPSEANQGFHNAAPLPPRGRFPGSPVVFVLSRDQPGRSVPGLPPFRTSCPNHGADAHSNVPRFPRGQRAPDGTHIVLWAVALLTFAMRMSSSVLAAKAPLVLTRDMGFWYTKTALMRRCTLHKGGKGREPEKAVPMPLFTGVPGTVHPFRGLRPRFSACRNPGSLPPAV